jgi:hypothetical protein
MEARIGKAKARKLAVLSAMPCAIIWLTAILE